MYSEKSDSKKYVPFKLLGEGSFGKAYLVENTVDKSLAVVKVIDIESMSENERKEAYFEAKIHQKLDHHNIVKFRDIFFSKKPKFLLNIVMDFADGGDLQKRIKAQKGKYFSENQILDWFTQICLAIKHIHDRKILHRDIKSQNIFLTKHGLVKLGDFGISKLLTFTLDKVSTVVGTPYYLSPEIVQNKPYSFKSDIWSLGVLLYEMCALKMPFDAVSLPMLTLKIIRGNYISLPSIYSKELKSLVMQMLSVDENQRPNINDILRFSILNSRIKNFLNEVEFNAEFSHTILHNQNILKEKGKKVLKEKESSSNNFFYMKNENEKMKQLMADPTPLDKNKQKNYYVIGGSREKEEVILSQPEKKESEKNLKTDKKNELKDINNFLAKKSELKKKNIEGTQSGDKIVFKTKNNEKEKRIMIQPHLKDFIKKMMKDLEKNNILIDEKQQDLVNKASKESIGGKEAECIERDDLDIKDEEINTKDWKDFINTQKMLMELHEINNNQEKYAKDELSKSLSLDNKSFDIENKSTELEYEDTIKLLKNQLEGERDLHEVELEFSKEKQEVAENEESEDKVDSSEEVNNFKYNNYEVSEFEEITYNLERELGSDLFSKIKNMVSYLTPEKQLNCDIDNIAKVIYKDFETQFPKVLLDKGIEKIIEIYSLVVKEREKVIGYNK